MLSFLQNNGKNVFWLCVNIKNKNNKFVHWDKGNSDRRYFILEEDSSDANDQSYYGPFL